MSGNVVTLANVRKSMEPPHAADTLSFMRRREPAGTGIDYWVVESTGSRTDDYALGDELGCEFGVFLVRYPSAGNMTELGCIVQDMAIRIAREGRISGIELGFLRRVSVYVAGGGAA